VTALENLICSLLDGCREFGGYHCHKEMIVFRRPLDAVMFGLLLKQELSYHDPQDDGANLAQLIKIGCIHGDFLTMGPHRKTGRADYFGQIVNRAARLSSAVKAGSVCLGVVCCGEKNDQEGSDAPVHNPSIEAQFCGRKLLRGIQQEIDVFEFTYACEL
jgi:class 3 adenylate cyclase